MSDDHEDLRRRYRIAFSSLPWVQRQVFELHCLKGLSYAEIAFLLRVSERFVERQIAKAIYKIAKQLDGRKLHWWERLF